MRIELKTPSAEQVFNALSSVAYKGQNIYVEWTRDAKTRKACDAIVTKSVRAAVRYGVNYANMASVRDAIASGERGEVESLPWGQWRNGREGMIIEHNGKEYCRFACGTFANMKRDVEWTLNGKASSFEQVKPFLLASELTSGETPQVLALNAQTITAIGAE